MGGPSELTARSHDRALRSALVTNDPVEPCLLGTLQRVAPSTATVIRWTDLSTVITTSATTGSTPIRTVAPAKNQSRKQGIKSIVRFISQIRYCEDSCACDRSDLIFERWGRGKCPVADRRQMNQQFCTEDVPAVDGSIFRRTSAKAISLPAAAARRRNPRAVNAATSASATARNP